MVFFMLTGKSLCVQSCTSGVIWLDNAAAELPFSRDGYPTFVPAYERMACAPADNSKRDGLLPVCPIKSCRRKTHKMYVLLCHLWAFFETSVQWGQMCLVIINSMLVLLFTCLTLQLNTLQRLLHPWRDHNSRIHVSRDECAVNT